MRLLLAAGAVLLGLASSALAQGADQAQAQAQAHQPPSEITLKLPMQMMLVIAKGIQELPYKEASPVLNEVQRQVNEQLALKPEQEKK